MKITNCRQTAANDKFNKSNKCALEIWQTIFFSRWSRGRHLCLFYSFVVSFHLPKHFHWMPPLLFNSVVVRLPLLVLSSHFLFLIKSRFTLTLSRKCGHSMFWNWWSNQSTLLLNGFFFVHLKIVCVYQLKCWLGFNLWRKKVIYSFVFDITCKLEPVRSSDQCAGCP